MYWVLCRARKGERTPERLHNAQDWRRDKKACDDGCEPRPGGYKDTMEWDMPGEDMFISQAPPTSLDEFEAIRQQMRAAWAQDSQKQVCSRSIAFTACSSQALSVIDCIPK